MLGIGAYSPVLNGIHVNHEGVHVVTAHGQKRHLGCREKFQFDRNPPSWVSKLPETKSYLPEISLCRIYLVIFCPLQVHRCKLSVWVLMIECSWPSNSQDVMSPDVLSLAGWPMHNSEGEVYLPLLHFNALLLDAPSIVYEFRGGL